MEWVRLVPSDDVAPGAVVGATAKDQELVLWRTAAGRAVAMDARCPHQWSHLGVTSEVNGDQLICTAHFWRFDATGRGSKRNMFGRSDPKGDAIVYPCRERDGFIEAMV